MYQFALRLLLFLTACSDVQIAKQKIDLDEDGYVSEIDCDDGHKTVHPDAEELCDGLDNDCDEFTDEDATDGNIYYADTDGDGYGDPNAPQTACAQPPDFVADATDCNDQAPTTHPGAAEICDGIDNDCNGLIDDNATDLLTFYEDNDGDSYGNPDRPITACTAPTGSVTDNTDCDDADNDIYPDALEDDCTDPTDYNCDGRTTYRDNDGDGTAACEDCDDNNSDIHPGAQEVCDRNDTDEDCNGWADNDDPAATGTSSFYLDNDGDGYGDPTQIFVGCDAPPNYVRDNTDCDDRQASIHPTATEICDAANTDEDCDGLADDADPSVTGQQTWYLDADLDGFGDTAVLTCDPAYNQISIDGDCDDTDPDTSPLGTEVCGDGIDQDCSGMDEACNSGSCNGPTTFSTLNYNGMSYYMLALDPCLPYYSGNCCSGTTDQQEADAFCQLVGCSSAASYTVELKLSTSCYCWGQCTNNAWYSPCCSGSDTRYFITEVVCQ